MYHNLYTQRHFTGAVSEAHAARLYLSKLDSLIELTLVSWRLHAIDKKLQWLTFDPTRLTYRPIQLHTNYTELVSPLHLKNGNILFVHNLHR